MKFYIASGFANIATVRHASDLLRRAGHVQTYDWTQNDRAIDIDTLRKIGTVEFEAILACDVLLLILPAGKGSHTELGIALAAGKQIYIYAADGIQPETAASFYYVDGVTHCSGTIEDTVEQILERF